MPSYNDVLKEADSAPRLVLVDTSQNESAAQSEPNVQLSLTATEAQELLNRVLNSNEEDTETMSSVILKLADGIRRSARAESNNAGQTSKAA